MDLSDIQGQLTALMNRRDFTANTSLQMTFITQGLQRINRELRCPAMEKVMVWTVPILNPGFIPIPPDFLELIDIYDQAILEKLTKVDLTRALRGSQTRVSPQGVVLHSSPPGPPTTYARQGGMWLLSPTPQAGSTIIVEYWCEVTPLVNPTDTNQLSTIAWDLIVYGALVQAAIFYKDTRKDDWEAQYQKALGDTQDQSDQDDENSAAVVEPCYAFPLDWQFEHY